MAVFTGIIAAIAATASAVGAAVTGGLVAVGLGAGAAGVVGGAVAVGLQGAVYGAAIGGATSKLSGGSFSQGAKFGAKMGAAAGFGSALAGGTAGAFASTAKGFTTAKTIGGFVGGGLATKAVGATNQQALMFGAAGAISQYGSAVDMAAGETGTNLVDNFKAAATAAPTMSYLATAAGLSAFSGAAAPQVATGMQFQPGNTPANANTETPDMPTQITQTSAPKGISDQSFFGSGINKDFDPSLTAGYQAPPNVGADTLASARKSFVNDRAMQRRKLGVSYDSMAVA